jgi:long-chain acyl-CoA synthetase
MVDTLGQLLLHTLKTYPKNEFILHKVRGKYTPISTQEFVDGVKYLSLGLRELGFSPRDKLVIFAPNGPTWVMTDFAALCLGGITVPIYTTLVPDQVKYIIDDSDAKFVVCAGRELWQKIEVIKGSLDKVSRYIFVESDAPDGVLTLAQIQKMGKKVAGEDPGLFEKLIQNVQSEDLATIIYTSGTTGIPKGVMLTHGNFISNVKSTVSLHDIAEKDTVLSFLPLTHVLERWATFVYFYKGCTIGYAESLETLAANLLEVRPHKMVNVPRALEKIYARVLDNVMSSSPLKKKIFFWAIKTGRTYARRQIGRQPISKWLRLKRNLANRLVFSKIHARTGGRAEFFVCGGAALSKDIGEFFHALGLAVYEGYGLTETSPVIACNFPENHKYGTVGKPIPGVEVRIAGDGEILTRGPNVMKGYYKMEEATRETFEGGWFRTGDIGHFDDEGFLVITDRKKNILVTSGGKNVAPQPIENMLKLNPYIVNAVVVGDGRRFVSALVVPDFEKLAEYARANKIGSESRAGLIQNPDIVGFLYSEVEKSTPNLDSYEKIKKIALLERDFEIDQGEMTPSYKVKRNIVEKKYKALIDSLYEARSSG